MQGIPTKAVSQARALARSLPVSPPASYRQPAAPRPACAPTQLAAYGLGATLWTPPLMLVAWPFEQALALVGLPMAGAAATVALIWTLRFAFYAVGAGRGWDYGYGINGVIVNRRLALADKARRIARDWFGIVLGLVWIGMLAATLTMASMR